MKRPANLDSFFSRWIECNRHLLLIRFHMLVWCHMAWPAISAAHPSPFSHWHHPRNLPSSNSLASWDPFAYSCLPGLLSHHQSLSPWIHTSFLLTHLPSTIVYLLTLLLTHISSDCPTSSLGFLHLCNPSSSLPLVFVEVAWCRGGRMAFTAQRPWSKPCLLSA